MDKETYVKRMAELAEIKQKAFGAQQKGKRKSRRKLHNRKLSV